jgi:uncharacterized FlaG/YvyC family protein
MSWTWSQSKLLFVSKTKWTNTCNVSKKPVKKRKESRQQTNEVSHRLQQEAAMQNQGAITSLNSRIKRLCVELVYHNLQI